MFQQKKSAFTLIELLVVIVIIGILATIGVAQYNAYQGKARDARRQSNLSTIAKLLTIYTTVEEQNSHMKQTCDTSGETIEYADSHYGLEGNAIPDNSHVACLVKYLREQGVSFPDPATDCYVMFYESYDPENFMITSSSEFSSDEVIFMGNSETRAYVIKDGGDPFHKNYTNLKSYISGFEQFGGGCREYGLGGLRIYRSAPYGSPNTDYVNMIVEPLDPRYFD